MSVATKDGAWMACETIYRFDCTKCGTWFTSKYSMSDYQIESELRKHALEKHGGINR